MPEAEMAADFAASVREALRLWSKDPSAGSPLENLTLISQSGKNGDIRRATNQLLLDALQSLAVDHKQDAILLKARYLDGMTIAAVANQLNMTNSTVYKMQHRAIDRLAATIFAMEQQAVADRQSASDTRLPTGDRIAGFVKQGEPVSSPSVQPVLNSGKAWAVLIGVNTYENQPHIPSLHVCVDDVTAVQAVLAGTYAAARLLTDKTPKRLPTRANILAEMSSVAQAAGEGDLLLVYFSGHGIAAGGESYLLPRDARLAALKYTGIAIKDLREIIDASPARAKVIVLDACHSGAVIGKAGPVMTPEFIQRVFTEAQGIAVLASCTQGQQSWEWPEKGRSVFTHFLLEALSGKADLDGKGFVTVSDASRYVTDGVKTWAVNHSVPQTPTLQYTVAGDIVLLQL